MAAFEANFGPPTKGVVAFRTTRQAWYGSQVDVWPAVFASGQVPGGFTSVWSAHVRRKFLTRPAVAGQSGFPETTTGDEMSDLLDYEKEVICNRYSAVWEELDEIIRAAQGSGGSPLNVHPKYAKLKDEALELDRKLNGPPIIRHKPLPEFPKMEACHPHKPR